MTMAARCDRYGMPGRKPWNGGLFERPPMEFRPRQSLQKILRLLGAGRVAAALAASCGRTNSHDLRPALGLMPWPNRARACGRHASELERGPEVGRLAHPEVEVGLDMIDMADHQRAGGLDVAAFDRGEDVVMLVMAAARHARLSVERDDERGARHQLIHEPPQNGVAGEIGERQVEIAGSLDLGAACRLAALRRQSLFGGQQTAQVIDFGGADPGRGRAQKPGLDQPAGGEDLPGFIRRGMGDEGASVLLDTDQPLIGKRLQAARTSVRLTLNRSPTSLSDSLVPGASRRSTIASRSLSRICRVLVSVVASAGAGLVVRDMKEIDPRMSAASYRRARSTAPRVLSDAQRSL